MALSAAGRRRPASRSGSKLGDEPRPKLGRRFDEAFLFAARAHAHQKRKGTDVPYLSHLMGVACLVLEGGGDEDQAIAALLHDAVEDCGGAPMLKKIEKRFGKRVAQIVDGCTDTDQYPKPPWRERKEEYLRRLRVEPEEIRLVSAADKLHNSRSIVFHYREHGEQVWERFNGKRDGTLWYYRELVKEFRRRPNPLTGELERVVAEMLKLAGGRKKTSSKAK